VLIVAQTTQKRLVRFESRERLKHAESTEFSCASGDDETSNVAENISSEIISARARKNRSRVISDEL
jgi:TolB-like protein